MTIEDIQSLCKTLPGVTEDIKWEKDLCFCVAEKMFFVIGLDQQPVPSSFKVKDEEFDELCSREGFQPAPYLARYKWVSVDDLNRMNAQQWEKYIRQSYELVKSKLPKKKQKELEL
jgi:predicted DNA-binding protein (MmcQ/YjbR family)